MGRTERAWAIVTTRVKVDTCTACPFFWHDDMECEGCGEPRACTHPAHENDAGRALKRGEMKPRPKWCPLVRIGSVLVEAVK